MPHRSTVARRQMKKDDRTKYEEFLRKRREAEQKKRDEEKKKWEEESHTRSQIKERQRHVEEKRARERERYWKKKAEKTRQTRSSLNATPGPSAKRPRDMSPEEYKRYRADQRKRERDNLSTQKKTAIKMKRREQRKKSRDEKEQLLASAATPEAGPLSDSNRLRQSLYNLNHERKPLATRSNTTSRLPVSGPRFKRARSPTVDESINLGKKQCVENKTTTGLTKHLSSSGLTKEAATRPPTVPKLQSTRSTSNLMAKKPVGRAPVSHGTAAYRVGASTAPRPVQGRPPTNAASTLNSTIVSTGSSKAKKRPAWDLKGRLQDMETHMQNQTKNNSNLQGQVTECNFRIAHLESLNQKLSGDVQEKQMASQSAVQEIEKLKEKLNEVSQEHESERKKLRRELDELEFEKSTLDRQKKALEGELAASQKQVAGLLTTVGELTSAQALVKAEMENTKQLLAKAYADVEARNKNIEGLKSDVEQRDAKIKELEAKERTHETERRRLHNLVQELKGNIRVFCRVRPLLGDEQLGNDGIISHMNFPDLDHRVLELDKLPDISVNESVLNATRGGGRATTKYEFNFDKVFQPESSQAEVFEEISQLVQSALDGYNVCIFAYGQTGSGKTYTMEGCLEDEVTLGMIPRTVQQIFTAVNDLESKGWTYKFAASMLEIYNENIYDLLCKGSAREEKLEVKLQGKGEDVHVPKLTIVDVKSEQQVLNVLRKAYESRSVAETKCNQRSSRSHSVFQLRLEGTNSITGESSKGLLNLVDLAGSERVKESGSEGQRLVEAQSINKSLSNLGNVILSLGNKEKHIPYRNSKLTYLLQNSLGGNSKTLMFVNVSPKEECFSETLNSLRFATKVNQCNIGTARKKS